MIDSCYKKVLVLHFRHVGFFDMVIDFSGICKGFCWSCAVGARFCVILSMFCSFFVGFCVFFP